MSVSSADGINVANWTTTKQLPNPPAYKHAFLVLDPGPNPEINPKAGFWASSTNPEPIPALTDVRTALEAYRYVWREREGEAGGRGEGWRGWEERELKGKEKQAGAQEKKWAETKEHTGRSEGHTMKRWVPRRVLSWMLQ